MDFPKLKNDLVIRAARGEKVERTPVWIMRQAGRYLPEYRQFRSDKDFFTICQTPEFAMEVTMQPLRRFDLDASIIFSDILVIPQAMNMEVKMVPGKGPVFPEPLVDPEDLDKIELKPNVSEKLKYVYDAITLTRKEINGQCPLFGFTGAPWTLMAYMIEGGGSNTHSKAKKWLYQHPEKSHELLDALVEICIDYLVCQVRAGAQLLQVFESHGGALNRELSREFTVPGLKRIATEVKKRLGPDAVPMSIFARGGFFINEDFVDSDYDIIQLDWTVDVKSAKETLKGKTLQGNMDPCYLYAPKNEIEKAAIELVENFRGVPHIANLGHGIYQDTDPDKLKVFIDTVHAASSKN